MRKLRIKRTREAHGTQRICAPVVVQAREFAPHEAVVEADVVRHEHPAFEPRAQLARDLLEPRRIREHFIVDSGELSDACRNMHAGIHQALPLELEFSTARADHRDVDDSIRTREAPSRLDIDEGERRIRLQLRSIHVVLSSVYLSRACSDLSRPMPDCLKPPNGTVMSSAS